MGSALDISGLLGLLDAGQTVILPTERAARALRDRFDRQQTAHDIRAWEPANVLTWREWTTSLWSALLLQGTEDRVLLNRLQEQALWAEIIADARNGAELAADPLQEMATLASSALELAAAHLPSEQLSERLQSSADTFDAKAFAAWYAAFTDRCHAERLLPRALLEHALEQHAREHRVRLQGPLHLVGFDRPTPAHTRLCQTLKASGVDIHFHTLRHAPTTPPLRAYLHAGSPQDELRWAVRWLRDRYQGHPDPDATFALILPDPAKERAALEPLLREILAPELERVDADLSSTPWHFNTGPVLSSLPLITDALALLRWAHVELPLERIGGILLSPFFAHSDDVEARARFEMHTLRRRDLLRPELSLRDLLGLAREPHRDPRSRVALEELHKLDHLIGAPGQLAGSGSYGDWTELTRKILRAAGWPGPRTLSPSEFRATEAWEGLLDQLATLDLHGQRLNFSAFLQALTREAHTTSTPEPTDSALLQIARLETVEACLFDAALVLHATDQILPPPERAHPFLGWALQQRLGLPGTDPALTQAQTRDALRSLSDRSGDLLILAAAEDENGPLRLTPLAAELGLEPCNPASLLVRELERALAPLVAFEDTAPLPPLPHPHVPGGARVLELQAACGFRAFASLRLRAEAPESRALGLNARESGNLLHRAMELLWSELKTQQRLRNLPDDERRRTVEQAVASAFEQLTIRHQNADTWAGVYLDVLQQRLSSLILRWLPFELERADFTVLPPEQKQTVNVGPVELSVRLDRIDKVDEGYAFIDYKTAFDLSTKDWLGERPDAPQLPLYTCLAEPAEVRGVAFARLRPGKDMAWIKLQDRHGLFPAKRNEALHDLAAEMSLWRAELDRLAHAFAEGNTEVDPKLYPNTCQHCDQRLLCRLNPAALLAGATNDPDAEVHGG